MFYASLLDATRAEGLAEARRDPVAAFAPLKLRARLRVRAAIYRGVASAIAAAA
jgi:hypothetical protein